MTLDVIKNPWEKSKELDKKINDYIKSYKENKGENFSWVLDTDQKYILNYRKKTSIAYGIPHQSFGDVENAIVYDCGFNPRTNYKTGTKEVAEKRHNNGENIKEFVDKECLPKQSGLDQNKEFYDDINEYYNHFINKNNIFYQEIYCLSQLSPKKQHELLKKADKTLAGPAYYIYQYYSPLFARNKETKDYAKVAFREIAKYIGNKEYIDSFKKLKFANIELVPYRTFNSREINFGEDTDKIKYFTESSSAKYAVQIIINRIIKYLKDVEQEKPAVKPLFIFRSQYQNQSGESLGWRIAIKSFLENDEVRKQLNKVFLNKELVKKISLDNLESEYFAIFNSNSNTKITKRNVSWVKKEENRKFPYDEYKELLMQPVMEAIEKIDKAK